MAKIVVASAVHCPAPVANLMVGSVANTIPKGHEISYHMGVHKNYGDYTHDYSLFTDLDGIANFHFVDEIDWNQYHDYIHRYSIMHAKNIYNVFQALKYFEWDYILITDQDVFYKSIPIDHIIDNSIDFYTDIFDAKEQPWTTTNVRDKAKILVMPKPSACHMILSRKAFTYCDEHNVFPEETTNGEVNGWYLRMYGDLSTKLPVFYDTFSKMYHNIRYGSTLKTEIGSFNATHFSKCSFNYGAWTVADKYWDYISRIEKIYNDNFPNGLAWLKNRT